MDAITRIKLQKQPKKDFLRETKAKVEEAMQPQLIDTEKVAKTLIQPTIDKVSPEVEQQPFNPEKVAENGSNQVVTRISPRLPTPVTTPINTAPADIQVNASQNIKQLQSDISKKHGDNTNLPLSPTKTTGVTVNPITVQAEAIQHNKQNISDINYTHKRNSNTRITPELAQEIMQREGYQGLFNALNQESAYEGQDEIDKRDKREKQRNLITSIADGLSSIANIGGTLAGGVAQKQSSLSDANMKRREYQRQLRERDREKWQQMMLRTGENQQNYELAKDRQSLMNEAQQSNLRVKEMELALKSQRSQGDIDKIYANIADEKEEQKRKWSEYNLKVNQFNEQVKKNNWQKDVGYIKAGASATSANASALRASSTATNNEAEIKGRKEGWWNKNDKSSGSEPTPSKYTPTTEEKPTPAPKKQAATKSQPAKTTNTSSLGEYGYKSNNKKHQKNPFE